MKVYRGFATKQNKYGGKIVTVQELMKDGVGPEHQLEACLAIANHSPDGFNWGYNGSGATQLALALLVSMLPQGKVPTPQQINKCREDVVAKWPMQADWMVTEDSLKKFLSTPSYARPA